MLLPSWKYTRATMANKVTVTTRLSAILRLLQLARTSREANFTAVAYIIAAEVLIQQALEKQHNESSS